MELFNLRRWFALLVVATVGAGLTGCASIVDGTNQVVSVTTRLANQEVSGAKCELTNDKGKFYVTTPGTVTVHRAYGDLSVMCEKPSLPSGTASVKSSTKGMAMGNILVGGIIGAAVDASSGAAYDYPNLITIRMGEAIQLPVPVAGSGNRQVREVHHVGNQGPRQGGGGQRNVDEAPGMMPPVVASAVQMPAHLPDTTPAEQWEGMLNCVAREDGAGAQAAAYHYKVKMEMRGDSATMQRVSMSTETTEILNGTVRADVLNLSGTGYKANSPNNVWQYNFSGEMRAGAATYLGKGNLLVKGKLPRECQVVLKRIEMPTREAERAAAAPAKT